MHVGDSEGGKSVDLDGGPSVLTENPNLVRFVLAATWHSHPYGLQWPA